jgi:hypothetical protein
MEGYYHTTYSQPHSRTIYIVHNTTHALKSKANSIFHFYRYYMHRGLPCSKGKLVSVVLHEVVPQAHLQRLSSRRETFTMTVPTCDDMPIYI